MNASRNNLLIGPLLLLCGAAGAVTLNEASAGDFANDRLAPTLFVLDYQAGTSGHNVLSGSIGRGGNGVVDRDYLRVVVPAGYRWHELRVGQQTFSGGVTGAFIGLASGSPFPLTPDAQSATGLLGWWHYSAADRGTDIFEDLSKPANGSSGFVGALSSGEYSVWIQELAPGNFDYRFNFMLSPVPEASTSLLLLAGLAALGCAGSTRIKRAW